MKFPWWKRSRRWESLPRGFLLREAMRRDRGTNASLLTQGSASCLSPRREHVFPMEVRTMKVVHYEQVEAAPVDMKGPPAAGSAA